MASERRPAGQPLVVGIDARAAVETKAGRGRLVRELLLALAERDDQNAYRCYCRTPWEPLDSRSEWVAMSSPDAVWHARAAGAANRDCAVSLSAGSDLTTTLLRVPTVPPVYDLIALDP